MTEAVFDYLMRFITGGLLGGILGSFITMLSYRLPRGRSIISPRSSCPSCQKIIPWKEMVPIYSYWQLKGKCSNCGKAMGKRYFNIECVSAAATALILLVYGLSAQGFMLVLIFAVLYTLYIVITEQGKKE